MAGKGVTPPLEAGLLTLAGRQHGVVARSQLRGLGYTGHQIDSRIGRGWLRPVHRGVYAVGGTALARKSAWMAATLALGHGAALSHRSAAELWQLVPGCSSPVHVTALGAGGRKRREGLSIHRAQLGLEVTRKSAIPVIRPERTLIDLAEVTEPRRFERALDEAVHLNLTTEARLRRAIDRHPGRSGAAKLSAVLTEHAAGTTATENDFEELLLAICDQHQIPRPRCQVWIGGYRPDFLWPAQFLIVETDGRATHGTRKAFEDDRARDTKLTVTGYRTLRFTWRQLTEEPDWVAQMVRQALGL